MMIVVMTNKAAIEAIGYSVDSFAFSDKGFCVDGDFGLMGDFATEREAVTFAIEECKYQNSEDGKYELSYAVD